MAATRRTKERKGCLFFFQGTSKFATISKAQTTDLVTPTSMGYRFEAFVSECREPSGQWVVVLVAAGGQSTLPLWCGIVEP